MNRYRAWRLRRAIKRLERQQALHWEDGVQEISCWECYHGTRCHINTGLNLQISVARRELQELEQK